MQIYSKNEHHRRGPADYQVDAIVPVNAVNDRRGSVLLVVIGLLGMLLLLGVAFYSFAGSEFGAAILYAESAKEEDAGLLPDRLWDFALDQLILGTRDTNRKNSALWGRRHALLSGILGRHDDQNHFDGFDQTVFNGSGVHLQYSQAPGFIGDPYVDLDFDGTPDADQSLLSFNYSPSAVGVALPSVPTFPAPDTDFTRPDLNSLALAFIGRGVDQNGADVKVIKPSFHRPELLRMNGAPIPSWPTATGPMSTARRVMRPHPDHVYMQPDGTATTTKRFLDAPAFNIVGQVVKPFPFGDTTTLRQGVWDLGAAPSLPVTTTYQYDSDNDGDGTKEGIWIDLDFPMQLLPDGRMYVPLFSFTVVDADGLINLNISGNQAGFALPSMAPFTLGNGMNVSRSNMGLSRSEISPAWAMLADPGSDPASTTQHNLFWNVAPGTLSRMEMANSETLFLNVGRPEFGTEPTGTYAMPVMGSPTFEPIRYYPGRYDELELMGRNQYTASGKGMAGIGDGAVANRTFTLLPQPGRASQLYGPINGDDDNDDSTPVGLPSSTFWDHNGRSRIDNAGYFYMGTSFVSMRSGVAIPSFVHPLDFWGEGVSLQAGTSGLKMALGSGGLTNLPGQWPNYIYGYSTPGVDSTGANFQNYLDAGTGQQLLSQTHAAQIDEPDEIVTAWELATSNTAMIQDDVFGPDVMLELQGADADLNRISLQGRVRDLAPFNFKLSAQAEQLRHQFTVLSHDRKNFGLAGIGTSSPVRSWEFNANSDYSQPDSNLEFPPAFIIDGMTGVRIGTLAAEPFRQVLRQLLYVEENQTAELTTLTQLRLNLNKLLVQYDMTSGPVGAPVYRDLTPHPISLPNTKIVAPATIVDNPISLSPNDQEFYARYDRQRMARDIYVMLYTFGGGMDFLPANPPIVPPNTPANYTADNSARALYSDAQMKEMAQFAVNVVDALDRDNVITKFEYDMNLGDDPSVMGDEGWSVNDNPYDGDVSGDPDYDPVERGVVYGVEAQTLTFSEVMGIVSRKVTQAGNPQDHVATEVNDGDGDRYYSYIELRNASPFDVHLSNGEWQIAVQNDITGTMNGPDGKPNTGDETDVVQLTLLSGDTTDLVPAGDLFTIGSRGGPAAPNTKVAGRNIQSVFKVDTTDAPAPDFTVANPAAFIAPPSVTNLSLDLIPLLTTQTTNDNSKFLLTDGSGTGTGAGKVIGAGLDVTTIGNFLFGGVGGNVTLADETAVDKMWFVLRRRAHPTRAKPVSYSSSSANHVEQSLDNPWIEVDRMSLSGWRNFGLVASETSATIKPKLLPLTSHERAQPFSHLLKEEVHLPATGVPPADPTTDPQPYQASTIGMLNSNSPNPLSATPTYFSQVQLHFDRDFASVVDLLSVPLYGPEQVTSRVGYGAKFDNSLSTSYLAQERFLRPQHYDNMSATFNPMPPPLVPQLDNRWYRLFEFVEVPTQSESGLRSYPYALRTSGALNLNTIRHRGVLAGLLDDQDNPFTTTNIEGHFYTGYGAGNPLFVGENTMLLDTFESATIAGVSVKRDWWTQFLYSRDGADPLTGLILPGTPAGRPFRALGFTGNGSHSIDDTVLRSLPIDAGAATNSGQMADRRGLFESRMLSDRPSSGATQTDQVDPYTKERLLRKVVNNSTTRSNVFAVWITARYFEAVQDGSDIRIGDVMEGSEDHRGFFVIDRSLPEQAYSPNLGKYDYRKFVQYRKTLQ